MSITDGRSVMPCRCWSIALSAARIADEMPDKSADAFDRTVFNAQ
jgi:hypothetical protein